MRIFRNTMLLVSALAVVAFTTAVTRTGGHAAPGLAGWPDDRGDRVARAADAAEEGDYAVFDADNTLWEHDLEEALLPYLEMRGVLSPERLDPSLRLIPFRDGESLYSYYLRLCEIDDKVCYPWIAQAFSGLRLGELKGHVDDLLARDEPVPVTYYEGGELVRGAVEPPRIFPAQRELLDALRGEGVRVYVVSAAAEELVRMVASDPRYGLDVPPERVIGASMLLEDPQTERLGTARQRIAAGGRVGADYSPRGRGRWELTPYLWAPQTWYEGKPAAIRDYIDPQRPPVLVAGDSESDWAMLFRADVASGGVRIWVDRDAETTAELHGEAASRAAAGDEDADRGWVSVAPEQLRG
ncbi:HAD family hydrolase [Salinifilum ghardaiensis]